MAIKKQDVNTSNNPGFQEPPDINEILKMQLGPYYDGVSKGMKEAGYAHATEAIQQGQNPMEMIGTMLMMTGQGLQGNDPTSVLRNLALSNKTQQMNLSPEDAALKIKTANEALANQGLEGYEAKLTVGGGVTASKPSSYTTATSKENVQSTVNGIANGNLPPDLTKVASRRDLTNVSGMLAKKGLDLKQLSLDYQAEQSFVKSINSTQQLRLRQLIPSVLQGIDDLDGLNQDFKRTGIKAFNKATVEFYANGGGSKEQQQIAQKFTSQMTVLADEMGSIFMGGNTPTDRSLDMAQKLFRGDFNDTALKASNEQVKRNLGYRANAIESVQTVGTKGILGEGTIKGGKSAGEKSSSNDRYQRYLEIVGGK